MRQEPTDEKYITFKTQEFFELISVHNEDNPGSPGLFGKLLKLSLNDVVVIRRQDFFASPALATYAACIALVAKREADPKVKTELLDISDYFEHQAQLAAEEGYKLPDV